MPMRTTIRKWGHSLALRIPKAFALETRLAEGMTVDLTIQDRKLIVSPATKEYDLEHLLEGVTALNLHGETETGEPTGRETW